MIVNPDYSGADSEMADVEAAARTIGIKAHKLTARNALDIDAAFEAIGGLRVDAFMVGTDGFFITRRHQLGALAARHAIPAVYPFPDFPAAGGLLSYGVSSHGRLSPSRRLCRADFKGFQASRLTDNATGEV
jgi:ABC-type uncharacterized transport system substrate-binding protein